MAVGVGGGFLFPQVVPLINRLNVGTTSVPIAIGLILMMYPPLARVRYEEMGRVFKNGRVLALSLVQNWVIGPVLMFALAVLFLRDRPEYMVGLILIGLARCIAMVEIARSVFIYLGIPFLAGIITRFSLIAARGREWYEEALHPDDQPYHARRAAVHDRGHVLAQGRDHRSAADGRGANRDPAARLLRRDVRGVVRPEPRGGRRLSAVATLSFTAASNNFELAIAVAVATFGIGNGAAFAAVIGPLVEVPALIGLVNVALWFRGRWFGAGKVAATP